MDKLLVSKCRYDSVGKLDDNVGIVCSIWIGLMSIAYLSLFISDINTIIRFIKYDQDKQRNKTILSLIVHINIFIIQVYFVYTMCKLCRGWTALGVVFVLTLIVSAINYKSLF